MVKRTYIDNVEMILSGERVRSSLMIEGSRIASIDSPGLLAVEEKIDGQGCLLMPGVIDDQVHFREPGLTHKEDLATGSRAAVKGGVTTYLEMPNTIPTTTTCERLAEKLDRASRVSCCNYGFFIGATPSNLSELQAANRTPGIKIFVGSSTGDLLVDDQESLERIFAETTLPICAHCEDESTIRANKEKLGPPSSVADHSRIRDHQAAIIATRRVLDLAIRHRHRFHLLHVSTAEEVEMLKDQQELITAEVCPHHLFFSVDDYATLGTRIQMNPSVKTNHDTRALWQGLHAGKIQMMATDHAPHTLAEKARPYPESPSGLPAVENFLPLMLDAAHRGLCRLEQVIDWLCLHPALVWDVVNKGRIAVGYDADLVLVDLARSALIRDEEQATKSRWSPWHGVLLTGWPVRTWVMGQTAFVSGTWNEDCRGQEAVFDHVRGGFWACSR